jgi:hypothetical protein
VGEAAGALSSVEQLAIAQRSGTADHLKVFADILSGDWTGSGDLDPPLLRIDCPRQRNEGLS